MVPGINTMRRTKEHIEMFALSADVGYFDKSSEMHKDGARYQSTHSVELERIRKIRRIS